MNWLFWALLSALFAGLTAVFAKVGVAEIDSNLATALRTAVVLVFSVAIAAWTVRRDAFSALNGKAWLFLGLSGVATGLSWLCYFRALQLGEVSKVAPVDKMSVVVALVLACGFLGEKIGPREGSGTGLIVLGSLLLAFK